MIMNRKAYLKGLGIGIAVTCLVLMISGKLNNKMSDDDIIKRAKELGLVENSTLVSTGSVTNDGKTNDSIVDSGIKDNETEENADVKKTEEIKQEPEIQNETDETNEDENEKEPEKENETGSEVVSVAKDVQEDSKESEKIDEEVSEFVVVSIKAGDSSETVSSKVKEAGLVDDSKSFNSYLCKNGYDKVMRVGNHEIPVGANEEEIAKILSGK